MLKKIAVAGLFTFSLVGCGKHYIGKYEHINYDNSSGERVDHCNVSVGDIINVTPMSKIKSLIEAAPKTKNEFEKTEAFINRRENWAQQNNNSHYFVYVHQIHSPEAHITYDADIEAFIFSQYFFNNHSATDAYNAMLNLGIIPEGGTLYERLTPTIIGQVQIDRQKITEKSYSASNAMGGRITVSKNTYFSTVVVEAADSYSKKNELFLLEDGISKRDELYSYPVGHIHAPPEKAKSLKGRLRGVVKFSLLSPYIIQTQSYREATFSNPEESDTYTDILVSDIQCGLIVDDQNEVLKVIQPNYRYN